MTPDEANTIRNRIAMYDRLMNASQHLQRMVNTLMLHRDKGLTVHVCGNTDFIEVPPEIADAVREDILKRVRDRQAELAFQRGELTSPAGTVNHE